MTRHIVIVGGVAGGMSAATRMRRLDPSASIIVLEKSSYVSYANCGLPYYIGGIISKRQDLLLQTPESLHARFELDVRICNEVTAIDRERKVVTVRDLDLNHEYELNYDALVLSPGAQPVVPPLPGIERALTNCRCCRGAAKACRRNWWRLHWHRDRGKPAASRYRYHDHRGTRSSPGAAGCRDGNSGSARSA
jgi:NADPH-dependent 2,4-dienoyl-CoA reductase/sulfur reductase-like enzyme